MALAVKNQYENRLEYTALSTDVSNNTITGVQKGAKVFLTDTKTWYRVQDDLTLLAMWDERGALPAGTATIGATLDAGPAQTITRTYTTSADMSTAAAITAAPSSGKKIVATDILVSTDTAMNFAIQMETSNTVLAKVYLPANGSAQISLRGYLKGDTVDKKLFGKASVAGNVAITAVYFSEA